jgi:hypothetical protein
MPGSKKPQLDSKLTVRRATRQSAKALAYQPSKPTTVITTIKKSNVDKHVALMLAGKKRAVAQISAPSPLVTENAILRKLLLATTESIEHYAQDHKGAVVLAHAAIAAKAREFLDALGPAPKKEK